MASLKTRNGTYYGQWTDSDRTPSQRRHSFRTKNRKTAQRLLDAADDAYKLGKWDPWIEPIAVLDTRPAAPIKLGDAVRDFLEARAGHLRPVTLDNYKSLLNAFTETAGETTPLARVAPSDVAAYVCADGIARTTMRTRLVVLRAFCSWGVQAGHITESPAVKVKTPPPPARLPKAVRSDELDLICRAIREDQARRNASHDSRIKTDRTWLIPCFRFAAVTGLRAAELSRMTWGDIDTENRLLRLEEQKSGKAGTMPLSSAALAALDTVEGDRDADAYVFCPPCSVGAPRYIRAFATNLNAYFRDYRKAAGIERKLTLHGLRHGFCTRLAEAGAGAFTIQAAARHASVKTSQVYVSISNQKLRAELDEVFG